MHAYTTVSLAAGLASLALAQYSIDPSNVPNATRYNWCNNQQTQCPLICLQTDADSATTQANSCDPNTLTYQCICDNGNSPNVSEYSQTLPYYICTEWGNECVSNCGTDNLCASSCRQDHPCGAQNPTRQNTSTLSATSSATSSVSSATSSTGVPAGATVGPSGTVYTGLAGPAATSTPITGASAALRPVAVEFGRARGLVFIAVSLFGGFAVLL